MRARAGVCVLAGSGKTGAFALPVLQALLTQEGKKGIFCLVLSPTRELCFQIRDTFDALGATFGLKTSPSPCPSMFACIQTYARANCAMLSGRRTVLGGTPPGVQGCA